MTTLETLQRKIEMAADLCSVVSTMKTLAAVSIRQYETAVAALVDYDRTIDMGFRILLQAQPMREPARARVGSVGAVVFGSDQGMCGQFNEQIVAFVSERRSESRWKTPWKLLVTGLRADSLFLDAGWNVDRAYPIPTSVSDISTLVQELLPLVQRWQSEAEVTHLLLFCNRRTSASTCRPQELQVLPIDPLQFRRWQEQPWQSRTLPIFTMDRRRLLSCLVRQYLFVSLFRACAESLASENASRIAAMQAAEKNIEERLEELRGSYHQLRQTAITEELLDVVTGFEALEQQRRAETARHVRAPD